jgi:hypothetical protein
MRYANLFDTDSSHTSHSGIVCPFWYAQVHRWTEWLDYVFFSPIWKSVSQSNTLIIYIIIFFFFFCGTGGLNSGPIPWTTLPPLFYDGFFWERISQTICLGWLQTAILLTSASWAVRIIGVSPWCPATVLNYHVTGRVLGASSSLSHISYNYVR